MKKKQMSTPSYAEIYAMVEKDPLFNQIADELEEQLDNDGFFDDIDNIKRLRRTLRKAGVRTR